MNISILFILRAILAAVICLAAAIFDIKTKRIPNSLTFSTICIGIIFSAFTRSMTENLIIIGVIIVWFFLGMTNFLGLGDIKLIMAVTAIGGWQMGLFSFVVGILLLCLFALICNPIETGIYIKKFFRRLRFKKEPIYKKSTKYKFVPFMFVGVIVYILFLDVCSPFAIDLRQFLGV